MDLKKKISINSLYLVLAFLLILGCSSQPLKSNEVVDLNLEKTSVDQTTQGFGPTPSIEPKIEANVEANEISILGLNFSPALYHSVYYIELLKILSEKKVKPFVLTYGFPALVVATFGLNNSYNETKWKLFKLFKELKPETPFSSGWFDVIEKYLKKNFKEKRLSQLDFPLGITNYKEGSLVVDYQSSIRYKVLESIKVNSPQLSRMSANSALIYDQLFRRFKVKRYYNISTLPRKIDLKRPNNFAYGLYTRISGELDPQRWTRIEIDHPIDDLDLKRTSNFKQVEIEFHDLLQRVMIK